MLDVSSGDGDGRKAQASVREARRQSLLMLQLQNVSVRASSADYWQGRDRAQVLAHRPLL